MTTKLETYGALKSRHSKESNNFEGIFWAFNNDQFKGGMERIGLTVTDTDKIYSIGAGGYILKTKREAFKEMMDRHDTEQKERRKSEKFLLDSLVYELQNHEYCISYDTEPALTALGLSKEDVDPKLLNKACKLAR